MKKRIGYLCLIIISILGSRLIFGKDYHMNSSNLIDNNLYLYDIAYNNDVTLTMVDDENLYYVLNNGTKYMVIKHNLISNKIVNEYHFTSNYTLNDIKMINIDNNLYLTAINSKKVYIFNKNLELVNEEINTNNYDSYSILKNSFITTHNNEVYKDDVLNATLPNSCGKNIEVIYGKNTYLHFHNSKTGFGCLYNLNTKTREYLDYANVDIVNNKLLEYQENRLNFKYDNNLYYFNDITESDTLKMHSSGDYLFTINSLNNTLHIYNLEAKKIIYERILPEINSGKIDNILIDDYAYFTVKKDNITKLYIWDYLKETRNNKNMISFDEKEYKFKNNELREEIKNKYNIDVYLYDQAVTYFNDYYVIPSTDDILINSRLTILKNVLATMTTDEILGLSNVKVCFEKSIFDATSAGSYGFITTNRNNLLYLAFDITSDNFKNNVMEQFKNINHVIN